MLHRRKQWLAAAVVGVVIAAIGFGAWLHTQVAGLLPLPPPNHSLVNAMMPSIIAYLQAPAYRDANNAGANPAAYYRAQNVRWSCNARIVEIRPDGAYWHVGMDVACGDYVHRGNKIVMADGGDVGNEVMTLSRDHGRYQVVSEALPPGFGVTEDPAWIDQHFSARAAADINRANGGPKAPWPATKVLRAFGCKPSNVKLSVFVVSGWPCVPA